MRSYTNLEWEILPHTIITSDIILDYPADEDIWFDIQTDFMKGSNSTLFNKFRDYCRRKEIGEYTLDYFDAKYHYFDKEKKVLDLKSIPYRN